MFSKEQLQRFSIRKLTVGTASVLIGVLFLTSWNTNNVYADSRNVTSGESIAKNNNPQEGNPAVNKDNVQIIDNNSTEVSNISDSKSSKVIKSDATKSDIVRDKTTIDDNSRTKVPELTGQANNKQALTTVTEDNGAKVSKTEKYSNSDIKNQSRNSEKTQETTLVKKVLDKEKLSSESLIDQKKLDGKVEITATDPSNTITATDPSNYPTELNGLIGRDKYIYQVLSLDGNSGSKLILSVNRNDHNDKNIYAYVTDGKSVRKPITIGMNKNSIIKIDGREYRLNNNGSSEVSINGKKEPIQNSSTVTSEPGSNPWYSDNFPIGQDYGLGNTSDGKCSAIGEIVPVFTKNSVIKYYYSDNEGNLTEIESSPNVTVNGFTGQEFEINDVGQYKKVIQGYYLTTPAPTGNFKGTLSQFSDGKYYKKVYYNFDTDTVEHSVLYHQISPDGTMEVRVLDDNDRPLTESEKIKPNTSIEFSNYDHTLTIGVRNPYVTAAPHEVQFIYKKLGSIIPVDENGNKIGDAIQFKNNQKDPTKALPGEVPSISGYHPSYELAYELVGDKKVPIKVPISVGDKVVPTDPGENIKVVYTANAQTATITYIDDDTTENKTLGSDKQNGKFNQVITFEHDPAEVIKGLEEKGYKLVSNNFDNQKYNADNSKNQFEVHFSHQTQNVKRNDTVSQTIHYVYDDGTKAEDDNAQTLSFEQHGVQDMVTHDIIWTPSDSQSFTAVTTPTITGYTPDVDQVDGHSVNFGDKDNVITVTYGANAQNAVIKFIDDTTNKTLSTEKADGKFNQVISFEHDPQALIVELQNRGYKLVSNNFNNQKYDSDNTKNQFEVHLVHGTKNVTRTDKVNRTIKYVYTNGQTAQPEVDQVVNFTEDGIQDLVTNDIDWTPAKSQTMDSVTTPELTGYTADKDQVASQIVNFGDSDQVITVTYSANAQQAGIKFIDDTDSKTLDHENANGKFDDEIKFNRDVNDEISQFEGQGYKLVSTNFNNNKYQSDNANNQFEVHFIHGTKDVSRDHNVIQTIHYVLADGTKVFDNNVQTLKFTQPGVQDLVTGKIEWTSIPSQTFTQVASPFKDGYTPDQKVILANTANFDSNDSEIIVTYTTNDQAAGIKYIDDTTGKTLDTHQASGKFGDVIKFSRDVNDEISQFESQNYKLVSNNFDNQKYVSDNTKNQFEVHFVHVTKNVTRTDKVNRTIHYVYSDGKTAEPDKVQVVNFTEDGVQDLVTGNITWTSAKSQKMVSVDTPKLEGYTPDIKSVASQTVNFGDKDLDTTVTYSADAQTATITYIDDTNENKTLGSDKQNGKFNQVITFEHDPAEVIKGLEEKGYKLVSNDFNSNKYQADNSNNVFYVHLKHGTSESSRKDDVNMTVHYVMDDGSKAPSDSKQTVSFTENGIKDNVTGNITWTPATSQTLKDVDSPVLTGYTADIKTANGKAVNFGDPDINVTVHYSANAQTAKITYIDDTTKTNLDSKEANGKFGQAITFEHDPAEVIKGLEEKGYVLVSNSFNKQTYDANNSNNVFYVHLKHGTKNVSRDHNVNMTVHYVMDDGSKAPSDSKQTVSFTESGIQDLVTQKITWTPADSQKFDDVVTPAITGYTPDQDKVAGQTANFDTQDRKVTVTYSPDIQLGRINYIDDNTGKTLTHDDFSGRTNEHEDYTPIDRIKEFENKGYELVSNDYPDGGFNFDDNDQQDQVFNVHLKHGTTTVTPENPGKPGEPVDPDNPDGPKYPDGTDKTGLTDTVNRTITYVMIDGSKAPDAVHDSLSYTASKVIDKVNGEVLETKWSANQNFKDVDSPSVKGYTTNKKTVSNKNVAHDAADITETVKYSADAQKASVTYIDDDNNGNTLKVDNLNGVTNAKSGYTTKAAIDTYTGLGYTLVSDDTNGNEVVFDNDDANDQAFTVHLSHGTITVTPKNPGKPGEPVDPDNPDGPKYPDGTDEYQVKRTGTQTIHYVGASDKTPADNNQTFIFTREITFDNVTGNIISVTPWNVQSHTFGNVDTPVIPGYHADKAVAGGATVTPDDLNRVITVTYAPDGNPGNPGDQGDTPTPEPTPEPDPTPNPTPDDQPDSEISSDEHFENVKAKDKLDKTNPKKMDAYKKERKIIKTKIAKQDHTEIAEPKLPQTGEADNSIIGLLGMLLASFAAMFGFDSLHSHDKKHKN